MGDIPEWMPRRAQGSHRWRPRASIADDGGMTESNAEPTSAPPPSAAATARLRRRANDRVAAGVASGLADYLNVDPLLIRVALVGLVLFNGAGFFIYLLAWLFIPVEGREQLRRRGLGPAHRGQSRHRGHRRMDPVRHRRHHVPRWTPMQPVVGPVDGSMTVRPITGFALALVVIAGGILLVRRTASAGPPGVTRLRPRASRQLWLRRPRLPSSRAGRESDRR